MAGECFSPNDLRAFINHHIALLNRLGLAQESAFSLIYLKVKESEQYACDETFKRMFRNTDAIFNDNEDYVLMLPQTEWNGASDILSGIQKFLDQESQDNTVCYPDDGKNADELMKKLSNIVEDNSSEIINMLR
ncbi:MAG: hypothetical protein PHN38_09480 [Sulfurospirillaceae bacterium]|nr:hypothetical protein [Sulfurospirillaceae bacterium]MDD3462947.1 hypothetical protein [Sulfurospirillaceae bacterium]